MTITVKKRFIQATKGKVVIGFLLACFTLLMAWGISKFVFKEMLNTVEKLSAPNDRFRIVNELSRKIAGLDQLQKDQAFNKLANENSFIRETRRLRRSLDTLSELYTTDQRQLSRIKSIKSLLIDRDRQFLKYLEVRETLINTKSFADEVGKLNELVSQRSRQVDSAVLTTATSTTTIAPNEEKNSRSFLSRLFGKKKSEVYQIINEEFKIRRDTLNAAAEDSVMQNIAATLQNIKDEQRQKSEVFLKREALLANSSNALTKQMLNILREVEAEMLTQIEANGMQAKEVVNDGIVQITAIIVGFFMMTLILVYLILSDITKINRYRKELELAKDEAEYHGKAKHRFLSNMSHEIRTPLQSIIGYSQFVAQQAQPNKKDLNAIYQSSMHLLQIVNEVLDYNRIISGEFSFSNQSFNMAQLLTDVIEVMRPLAEEKKLTLKAEFERSNLQAVQGDPFRLKQILYNLLGNAIKFTTAGEVVLNVTFKQNKSDLHFSFHVRDTGIGFSKADLDRIFNEFEQVDSPEKQAINQTGTGLGLSIVKSLVEQQGGRIVAKSEKGSGSTFSFFLAYTFATEAIEDSPINPPQTYSGKIWVVDDDQLILNLCGLIFEKHGIAYQAFNNANSMLQATLTSDIRFVLIDMRLPETTGLEVLQLLKKKMPETVKFYAITAQVLPDERQHVLENGFDGIIMKPFKAEELLSIFKNVTENQPTYEVDLTEIRKMTFGDEAVLTKILQQFEQDCLADLELLKLAFIEKRQDNCRLIIHRLAGRIGQIGAKTLAKELRLLELAVAENLALNLSEQRIKVLSHQFHLLFLQLKEETYSIS